MLLISVPQVLMFFVDICPVKSWYIARDPSQGAIYGVEVDEPEKRIWCGG
jgi:hypothetical protein